MSGNLISDEELRVLALERGLVLSNSPQSLYGSLQQALDSCLTRDQESQVLQASSWEMIPRVAKIAILNLTESHLVNLRK